MKGLMNDNQNKIINDGLTEIFDAYLLIAINKKSISVMKKIDEGQGELFAVSLAGLCLEKPEMYEFIKRVNELIDLNEGGAVKSIINNKQSRN